MDFLFPKVGKARKPKFDLHLKIYDLNNVPLVAGNSYIKWGITNSLHSEHYGRTTKNPIANHQVDYNYSTLVSSVRISIDRSNKLVDAPMEFEVLQEFAHSEKITLGFVKVNLSEYVEESEAFAKDTSSPGRKRSNSGVNPNASAGRETDNVEDGIVRRYLLTDSKVNSTLKIGILLIQVDGERNFIAPPLKTAPVFGGIAGILARETVEDDAGPVPSISKPRDAAELQDLYRNTLIASWSRQPTELPADECIEDIFSGGNGWRTRQDMPSSFQDTDGDDDDDNTDADSHAESPREGTLRPHHFRRFGHHRHHASPAPGTTSTHHSLLHPSSSASNVPSLARQRSSPNLQPQAHQTQLQTNHHRTNSGSSDKTVSTVTATPSGRGHRRGVRLQDLNHARSLASMTSTLTMNTDSLREAGYKRPSEVEESDVRTDLVAWRLPGSELAI